MSQTKFQTVIIGTGFSGICMAIELKKAGIHDFVILEKASDIGGTWRDNTYPGAACDVKSHLYSFSFEPKYDWSRVFSPQEEIWNYLRHCVNKYQLLQHIVFNWELESARFDDESAHWILTNHLSQNIEAKTVVMGTGGLHIPSIPEIPGLEIFEGVKFHSARWDHNFDLKGKAVAVIGTGASAIQFVPEIAPVVKQLFLFQRTPPWIIPKPDGEFDDFRKKIFNALPVAQKFYRSFIYWQNEFQLLGFAVNTNMLKIGEWIAKKHLKKQVADPALRKKLTPNYRMGCKRVLLSNNYYPALTRKNVEVVTDGISAVGKNFIETKNGERKIVDAVIFGTGFHVTDSYKFLDIKGRNGIDINEVWKKGPEAFLGMTVAGFPNLFFMTGPNSGLGHTSMVLMIEAQAKYILDCIKNIRRKKLKYIDVKPDVQEKFNRKLDSQMQHTVWSSGCNSWYIHPSGRNASIWPHSTFRYMYETRKMNPEHYVSIKEKSASEKEVSSSVSV